MSENNYSVIKHFLSNLIEQPLNQATVTSKELDELNRKYLGELDSDEDEPKEQPSGTRMHRRKVVPSENTNAQFSIMNYIKLPWFLYPATNTVIVSEDKQPKPNIASNALSLLFEFKKSVTDPLGILVLAVISIITYIYFASDFLCQLIGLFYPSYYMYILLNYRIAGKAEKIKSMMRYFIIYGHMEFVTWMFRLIGFPVFHHIKILLLLGSVYMAKYRPKWLALIYQKIIFYDQVGLGLCCSSFSKISSEYGKVSSQVKKLNK